MLSALLAKVCSWQHHTRVVVVARGAGKCVAPMFVLLVAGGVLWGGQPGSMDLLIGTVSVRVFVCVISL